MSNILKFILYFILFIALIIIAYLVVRKDEKKIYKNILALAWPSISEQFLLMLVGMIATIFISRLGPEYTSSVGIVTTLFGLYQVIFAALSTGSTVLIARFIGQNKQGKAMSTLFQSIVIGTVISIVFFLFASIFYKQIINVFYNELEANVLNLTYIYYKSTVIGIPFIVMDLIISGAQKGAGDTKTPMIISIIVNVVNVILNIFLVRGVNIGIINIASIGLVGAAIAVNVSRILGAGLKFLTLFSNKRKIYFDLKMKYRLDKNIIKRIFKIGIPSLLENFIMQGGFLFLQTLIISLDPQGNVLAGYQIGGNVHNIAFMPILGLSITTTTLVGQSLGMENYSLAEKYAKYCTKFAIFIGLFMGLFQISFSKLLIGLYEPIPVVLPFATITLIGFSLIEPFIGLSNVIASALRSAGDLRYILFTALVAFWSLRLAFSYVLIHFFNIGLIGVMIGIFLDFGIRSFLYLNRLNKGRWKYLRI
ncbi:MAG: MATE family efflux transporter [Oscillospiraceae bacterium]|nr:MATE family efflux transporter [Oscillospiraceae bacterium]